MDQRFVGFPGNLGNTNSGGLAAVPAGIDDGAGETKLHTDRYEVFVNGDKVGNKVQRTQVEDADYLKVYLNENGFEGFDYKVVGDHIEINAQENSGHMKEILSSYLSIT